MQNYKNERLSAAAFAKKSRKFENSQNERTDEEYFRREKGSFAKTKT